MSATTLATVTHAVAGLAFIVSATILLALHDIDSTTAMALFGGGATIVTGSAAAALALKVPTSSGTTPPTQTPPGV